MTIRRRHPAPHATPADPDAVPLASAQQNPQEFTALHDRFFASVYGYCQSHLGNPDAAEDATSQIFLKALSALPAYRETGRFRSWLFAIAHNVELDVLRGQRQALELHCAGLSGREIATVPGISHTASNTRDGGRCILGRVRFVTRPRLL